MRAGRRAAAEPAAASRNAFACIAAVALAVIPKMLLENVRGYFDNLLAMLDHAVAEGLLFEEDRDMLLSGSDAVDLIGQFERYTAPGVDKWL